MQNADIEQDTRTAPKPLLSALLAEIKTYCASRRGSVSKLASDLGTHQETVSAWLTHRQEPGGEFTLQMQAWLCREREAKKNARAVKSAAAPARLAAALRSN